MPVTGEIKICEIPNLILAYITIHYSAIFPVTLQIICFYISLVYQTRHSLVSSVLYTGRYGYLSTTMLHFSFIVVLNIFIHMPNSLKLITGLRLMRKYNLNTYK